MQLVPSYSRIIVKVTPRETTTAGGIHIPDSASEDDVAKGTITAVCEVYMTHSGPVQHGFKVGQLVFFTDKNTIPINIEGEDYTVVHIDNVEAVVTSD